MALATYHQSPEKTKEYLEELKFLATIIGAETTRMFIQKARTRDVISFVGKGKLAEIRDFVKSQEADMVIFDDDLSLSQL
ncbi:MAG: hypothetical protein ACUZ8O_00030 [Candidatus Anammoxibacter sp.]